MTYLIRCLTIMLFNYDVNWEDLKSTPPLYHCTPITLSMMDRTVLKNHKRMQQNQIYCLYYFMCSSLSTSGTYNTSNALHPLKLLVLAVMLQLVMRYSDSEFTYLIALNECYNCFPKNCLTH